MSIKREYGLNLLNKRALWEYRRRKSKIKSGDRIILYATAPDKKILGEFIVEMVITGSSEEIWEKTKKDVCYKKEEVVPYLESGDFPIAFKVANPKKYPQEISSNKISFFKPPMSYCKATEEIIDLLESL